MCSLYLALVLAFAPVASQGTEDHLIMLATATIDTRTEVPAPSDSWAFTPTGQTYAIVKFAAPTSEAPHQLKAQGLSVLRYLPHHAWVVRGHLDAVRSSTRLPGVVWVGPYAASYKIAPSTGSHVFVGPARGADPLLLLRVCLFPGVRGAEVAPEVESSGGEVREIVVKSIGDRLVVRAPRESLEALARIPAVEWIEEVPEYFLLNNRTRWVLQSNISDVTPVWNRGIHGEGQMVGIMDSGLDYNSCFFRDPEGDPIGPNHRKVHAYRLTGGAAYDGCTTGHGTHVTGTVLGEDIFGSNGAYNGLAYKARCTFQDVGQDNWLACLLGLVNIPSDLEPSYQNSRNDGAFIHTNSWGSTENSYDSMAQDVDNFMWNHKDFLVFFAMGNSGPSSGTIGSPATAKNCVSVGATQQAPNQNSIASYSSRGPTYDQRRKPTIVAPGGSQGNYINSANNHTGNPPAQTCNVQGDPFMGTSMATPAAAGAGLLVRQYFTAGYYPTGSPVPGNAFVPSAALVKAMLVSAGTSIGGTFPDNNQGWGRILLDDALYFPGDSRRLNVVDEAAGISTGQTRSYVYQVASSVPLEIVLVWTDYPAALGANPALVNDLDLEVAGPSGTYLGNVYSGGQSVPGGSFDRRNVVECVQLNAPQAGTYTVTVRAYTTPHGPQPFALVVTGDLGAGADTEPPNAVTDLQVTLGAFGGIRLTWSDTGDNVGVTRYDIYRSVAGYFVPVLGSEYHVVTGTPPATTWLDPSAGSTPGERYFYRIVASDAAGNRSAPSNTGGETVWELDVEP